tara:strand:- start:1242 stop:2177 length:936 start_codon:yes stop_codon:yes gene_type:complete
MYGIPHAFSLEQQHAFMQKVQQRHFLSFDGTKIHYMSYEQPDAKAQLLVLPGRTETYLVYSEVIYDFALQGYNVYALDHRGQGLSQRILEDPQVGHINLFAQYHQDLFYFVDHVLPQTHLPYCVLAHSMGGAIALYAALEKPTQFQAIALVAPMLGIKLPLPKIVVSSFLYLSSLLVGAQHYIPFGRSYQSVAFNDNKISTDAIRYQRYQQILAQHEHAQIGAPSYQWVREALRACEQLYRKRLLLKTPCLIFQAGQEQIVLNRAQEEFASQHDYVHLSYIEQAGHQILIEQDLLRNQVIEQTLRFFEQHI